MLNWKLAGEIYGVLSKVCFMIDSDRYNVPDEVIDAYEIASRALEISNEVKQDELQILLDFITDNTNSNYWIDFDEPLFIEDDEDDIETLDEDDLCDGNCENCEYNNEEPQISEEEIKAWAKKIGDALDEAAKDTGKPIRIQILVSEED